MNKISEFLKLIRWINIVLVALSVAVGAGFSTGFEYFSVVLLFVSISSVLVAANISNNIFDSKFDSPQKNPITAGIFSVRFASILSLLFQIVGLIAGYFLGIAHFMAVLAVSIILLLYNLYLKKILLLGNLAIAGISGFMFIYIGMAFGLNIKFVIASIFSFLTHFSREIIKDIEDVEQDKLSNAKTLPIVFPIKFSKILCAIILFIINLFLLILNYSGLFDLKILVISIVFIIPLSILTIIFLYKDKFEKSQKVLKMLMFFGLLALFLT